MKQIKIEEKNKYEKIDNKEIFNIIQFKIQNYDIYKCFFGKIFNFFTHKANNFIS